MPHARARSTISGGRAAADVLVVWALSALGWLPLLSGKYVPTPDGPFHVQRLAEMARAVAAGDLYPRWAEDFALGFGLPVFNYYAPLSAYAAVPFRLAGLGPIESLNGSVALAVLLMGLGGYLLGRRLFDRLGGVVLGTTSATAPYFLADIYVRAAVAETLALAVAPWVILGFLEVARAPDRRRIALAALPVAALVLAHNISAMIALPAAAALALPLALSGGARSARWRVGALALSAALGVTAAAVYWLPALAERDLVSWRLLISGRFDYHQLFLTLGDLVQPPWDLAYRADRFAGFAFNAPFLGAALGAIGAATAAIRWPAGRGLLLVAAGVCLVSLLVQTPFAAPVWENVPLLPFVQFPWRFLLVFTPVSCLLATAACVRLPPSGWPRAVVGALVLAVWIWSANAGLHGRLLDVPGDEVSVESLGRYEAEQKVVPEYTPRWVEADPQVGASDPPPPAERPAQVVGAATVDARTTRYAVAPGGGSLTVDRFYFPGWRAQTDAGPAAVAPAGGLGLLRVDVPPGASWVDVSFGDTPVRLAALAVSLVGVLAILALSAPPRLGRRTVAVLGVAAVGTLAFALAPRVAAQPAPRGPVGSFADGVRLLDAREEEPGVVQLAWTTDRPIADDLQVAVRLLDSAGAVAAERDSRPRRGLRPTTTFRPGYVVRDVVDYRLLPGRPGASAGARYTLAVGLVGPSGFVEPSSGPVTSWLDRCPCSTADGSGKGVVAGTVTSPGLSARAPAVSAAPAERPVADGSLELLDLHLESARDPTVVFEPLHPWLARFPPLARAFGELPDKGPAHAAPGGPAGVLATIRPGQMLSVALDWRVLRDLDEDYAVYLKLLDSDGRAVAQDDERPQRGATQMTLWHIGDVVSDGYSVRLPGGVGPARLTAVMGVYRRADLRHLPWSGPGAQQDDLVVGSVKVPPPPPASALGRPAEGTFGGAIELLGLRDDPGQQHARAGEALQVEPRWRVLRTPGRDYTVFVHLVDAAGHVVATGDAPPLKGRYPTSLWEPGEVIDDTYTVTIPPGASGRLGIVAGFYDPASGARLGLDGGGDELTLGEVDLGR